ncbi:MAG: hypothetical protein ACRDDH_05755, partial [Cetobacterium sp.]|uniref:hypothetical protein n=1 Tax=Cetobacterium sp. TaxID=2071632 RepID=UPI003EE4614D
MKQQKIKLIYLFFTIIIFLIMLVSYQKYIKDTESKLLKEIFLNEYKVFLNEDKNKNMVNYNLAEYYFSLNNIPKSIEHLNKLSSFNKSEDI